MAVKTEKHLLSDLDDTAVHHGVQPLDVRLDWRLLLQQTVKLLIHCDRKENISLRGGILHHVKVRKPPETLGCKRHLYATTSTYICDL